MSNIKNTKTSILFKTYRRTPTATIDYGSQRNTLTETKTYSQAVKQTKETTILNATKDSQNNQLDSNIDIAQILDKAFNKIETLMEKMIDKMMDRMIQLVNNVLQHQK